MYKMLLAAAAIFALTLHARADEPMQAVEAVGAQDVYEVITIDVPNMDVLKPIVEKVVAASEQEPGTITYAYMMTPDKKRVDIIMRFTDSDAALAHLKMFGQQYQKEFFAAAKQASFTVYGTANDDLKKALEPAKPTYMQPFAGFLSK
jgi:quinol monooxygenase YgiN